MWAEAPFAAGLWRNITGGSRQHTRCCAAGVHEHPNKAQSVHPEVVKVIPQEQVAERFMALPASAADGSEDTR